MPRKLHPVSGKMMRLVRTPDAGLYDLSHSWFDGIDYLTATDEEIELFFPDEENTLA